MDEIIVRLLARDVVPTGFLPGAMRIRYQADGLGLVRRDFRVDKAVWFRLGQVARTHGVSRCLLFVSLLRAYAEERAEFRQAFSEGRWLLIEILRVALYERVTRLKWRPAGQTRNEWRSG